MRRVPPVVWALVALHGLLLCCYALLFPPYTGFDEPQHVDLVVHVAEGETWPWPGPGEQPLSLGVAQSSNPVYFGALRKQPYTNDPYPDRADRKTLRELGGTAPATQNYPNQMIQHPPAYYALGAVVLKAWPGDPLDLPYDRVVHLLRLLSVVLMLPVPLLAFFAAERLGGRTAGVTAAALGLAVPGLFRVGSSVTNDTLLVLTVSALTVGLARVATGDLTRRTALAVGALLGLAMLTKGFALALPPFVFGAYLVNRRGWRLPWTPLALSLGTAGVIGGPWYVMDLVRFGTLQPDGLGPAASAVFKGPATPGVDRPIGIYVRELNKNLNRRFWGAIGMTDAPSLPTLLCYGLTVVLLVLVVIALVRRPERWRLAALLVPLPLVLAVVIQGSFKAYRFNGHLPGVQGRYLYPALVSLAIGASLGLLTVLGRRWTPLLALAGALLVQAWALSVVLRAYWLPGSDLSAGWHGILHWSAWPAAVTAIPLVGMPLTALVALGMAAKERPAADIVSSPAS